MKPNIRTITILWLCHARGKDPKNKLLDLSLVEAILSSSDNDWAALKRYEKHGSFHDFWQAAPTL